MGHEVGMEKGVKARSEPTDVAGIGRLSNFGQVT